MDECSTYARMKYVLTREMPDSKLHKVLKLTEIWKERFGEINEDEKINLFGQEHITYEDLISMPLKDVTKAQCLYVFEDELSNWAILKRYGIVLPDESL